jgi:DNA polymerase III beta subunit
MKVTIPVKEFARAFATASSVVQGKPTSPVLSYVKLEVGAAGATLTGSDLGMSVTANLAVTAADEQGVFLLPADKFGELIPVLAGTDITFEVTGDVVAFKSGKGKFKITAVPASQFPKIETAPEVAASLNLKAFKQILSRVEFAVPTKEGKIAIPVIQVEADGNRVRAVASDGGRIAIADFAAKTPILKLQLSKTALPIIKELTGDIVGFAETEQSYIFKSENTTFIMRKSPAIFPDYVRATQVQGFKTSAVIEAAGLNLSIQRVKPFVNKEKARAFFSFTPTEVEVFTTEDTVWGQGSDTLSAKVEGIENKTLLNPNYIAEFLGNAEGDVTVQLIDGRKLVKFANGTEYTYFIMPVMDQVATAAPAKETASASK